MEQTTFASLVPLLLFLLAVATVMIYTAIFAFHWNTYGSNKRVNTSATLLYLAGSSAILLIMALAQQFI